MTGREFGCKLVMLGFIGIAIFGFFGILMQASEGGIRYAMARKQAKDAENDLPLLLAGIRDYARQHNGKLPPLNSPTAMKKTLYPAYVALEDAFTRSGDNSLFLPNTNLSGVTLDRIKEPGSVPAFYEEAPTKTLVKGQGMVETRAVIFLDGTLRRLTADEWADLAREARL